MVQRTQRLQPTASSSLLLAARCQHLDRFSTPRSTYPEGKAGYLKWSELSPPHPCFSSPSLPRPCELTSSLPPFFPFPKDEISTPPNPSRPNLSSSPPVSPQKKQTPFVATSPRRTSLSRTRPTKQRGRRSRRGRRCWRTRRCWFSWRGSCWGSWVGMKGGRGRSGSIS